MEFSEEGGKQTILLPGKEEKVKKLKKKKKNKETGIGQASKQVCFQAALEI